MKAEIYLEEFHVSISIDDNYIFQLLKAILHVCIYFLECSLGVKQMQCVMCLLGSFMLQHL